MKEKFSYYNSLEYIYATISLIIIFCLLSLIELFKNFDIQLFTYKLLNDFFTGLLIGLLFFPLYLLLKYIKNPLGIIVIKVLFSIIAIIQLALIGYSLTTHINLGADLLGYSLSDMYTTVTASLSISFLMFLPFIVLPIVYLGLIWLFNSFGHKINTKISLLIIFLFGSLTFVIANTKKIASQNKLNFLLSDIIRAENDKALASEGNLTFKKEFPLEKASESTKDVLAPFFNIQKEKPNVVFIIMEGLGSDFTYNGEYKGFTPYLDSLATKSLYWENFVSNAGRTFGALPSLMGSLPFGENGFMELNPIPKHNSLISILKSNGYTTAYYSGDESTFDRKSNFLEYNGIDKIIDIDKFGPGYVKTKENSGGFSWGYPDAEIYRKTLSELKDKKEPRLDIIMTLTNHEPFDFPSKKGYLQRVERILNTKSYFEKNKMSEYKDIFACLLYTDNSIQSFMKAYSKRPDYENTIFIITGDHRLIPVPQKDNLSRFHVPFYIYSPMLKKTAKFKSISSHSDVTPSLVSFLTNNYTFNKLEKTTWIGQGLDTVREFRNIHNIPLMRYKGSINDYIYKDYFYSDGSLFKIDENFNLSEADNDMMETITGSFNDYKKLNAYLTTKNKITSTAASFKKPTYVFTPEQLSLIKKLTKGLNSGQIFFLARDLALKKEHEKVRLLCNYILNELPNNGDVRTLKGRTLAWDSDYKNAEIELLEVINRTPFYADSYLAIMDVYLWSKQNKKAIEIGKKGLANQINDAELGYKLAQAYERMKNKNQANKTIDSLIKIYPENNNYQILKKSLKK
ncbi:LTA synthase family protein [Flavobacterium gawalongense]|uniref:Sulfatase-like hydrolase/transferase n=1 Tax=Flavobacterium gawalongense TaxID=2594432 RepID=A0A553BR79_9FLAO|nr:LTA synthase family protein [Flavobacterium gawalongense]TRX10737.1 sulfatase-like hydrolase/transferase [Flavobacterium gawalongense]TRX11460.1 sulfatase-like hydrolase/transferase [Flavobacterium gawalongense]TRX29229.1 sulfatase-like hydrolase/transferase [Flavobacterium gawalongense]